MELMDVVIVGSIGSKAPWRWTIVKATKITVDLNVTIPDETIYRCLRILEMWMDDNPSRDIIVEKVYTTEGIRHKVRISKNTEDMDE